MASPSVRSHERCRSYHTFECLRLLWPTFKIELSTMHWYQAPRIQHGYLHLHPAASTSLFQRAAVGDHACAEDPKQTMHITPLVGYDEGG